MGVLEDNLDQFFLIIMGLCLLFMQSGFALLEAGAVRSKNVTNILMKNVCDSFISGVSYWLFGFAFAYGEGNEFIGYKYFAISNLPTNRYAFFFFQFTFSATTATIVSGAMAERCEFCAYFIFSFIITGFIYPLVTHWTWWPGGFLVKGMDYGGDIGRMGYEDFSGSGVVHVVGGMAAFVGATILGPRIGRFDPVTGAAIHIRGHSIPLSTLGGFILFFGFLTFNGASRLSLQREGDGEAISLAIVNTMITACFASFTAVFVYRIPIFGSGAWSITVASNGALTGMVASCAGCNVFYPWGSCVVGIIAGITYHVWCYIVRKLRIDDPADAVPINLGGGILGVIAVAFFDRNKGIVLKWNQKSGLSLAWQLAGLAVIMSWTAICSTVSFGIMKWTKILRVSEEIELKGLDIPRHQEPAYPVESYGHGHVETIIKLLEKTPVKALLGLTNMGFTMQEVDDKGPYEHPEVVAASRRNNNAIDEIHVAPTNSVSFQELHEKGAYRYPEWRPPPSHPVINVNKEVYENSSSNNSNFTTKHRRDGSIIFELDIRKSLQNLESKETIPHNSRVIYKMDERGSCAYPELKTVFTQNGRVVKELGYKD